MKVCQSIVLAYSPNTQNKKSKKIKSSTAIAITAITAIVRLPKMSALLDLPFFLGLGCVGGEMSNLDLNFINSF
jgi:hypothetical protein